MPKVMHPHVPAVVQQRADAPMMGQVLVHEATTQDEDAHLPPVQKPPVQSAGAAQSFPFAHLVQLPPQSTSDSVPFLKPSVHVEVAQRPPVQAAPVQSLWVLQSMPSSHLGQVPPPQSTSVSEAFFVSSVHV